MLSDAEFKALADKLLPVETHKGKKAVSDGDRYFFPTARDLMEFRGSVQAHLESAIEEFLQGLSRQCACKSCEEDDSGPGIEIQTGNAADIFRGLGQ